MNQLTLDDYYQKKEMTQEEERIFREISLRPGKENAISKERLAEILGMSERHMRIIIHHLRKTHRIRIGSSPGDPPGYYMIQTKEEARETSRQFWIRIFDMFETIRIIEGSYLELSGQRRLEELENELKKNP